MERSVLFFDIDGTVLSEITRQVPKVLSEHLKQRRRKVICFLLIQEELPAAFLQRFVNTDLTDICAAAEPISPTKKKNCFTVPLTGKEEKRLLISCWNAGW